MDVTAHVMVKNEEHFITPVMQSIVQAGFRKVLVADCGSLDRTFEKLVPFGVVPHVKLTRYGTLTPEENGRVRQHLTDNTKTRWAMLVDGDEYYWPYMLRRIVAAPMPEGKKFGFTTMANVQRDGHGYYIASIYSKHAVFDAATTVWEGAYPWEKPLDILIGNEGGKLNYYFGEDVPPRYAWHGVHLRCLPRSPYDLATYKRILLRETVHRQSTVLRRLRYLPVPLRSSSGQQVVTA